MPALVMQMLKTAPPNCCFVQEAQLAIRYLQTCIPFFDQSWNLVVACILNHSAVLFANSFPRVPQSLSVIRRLTPLDNKLGEQGLVVRDAHPPAVDRRLQRRQQKPLEREAAFVKFRGTFWVFNWEWEVAGQHFIAQLFSLAKEVS